MENFKILTHKRGRGRSPEVVFYKRLQQQDFDCENFGLLEMKSLIFPYGRGCLQEMVVIVAFGRGDGCTWRFDFILILFNQITWCVFSVRIFQVSIFTFENLAIR